MEPSERQFKSPNIFIKGNVEDDKRLAERAQTQRTVDTVAGQVWHEDTDRFSGIKGTKGTYAEPGLQKWAWNTDLSSGLPQMPLKGERRPDVVEEGKKRFQRGGDSKLKDNEDFYRSGNK